MTYAVPYANAKTTPFIGCTNAGVPKIMVRQSTGNAPPRVSQTRDTISGWLPARI